MKYRESKEQSAELLRLVLASMGQHDAAYNPVTYTVWFEHVAGINNRLSQGLAQAMQRKPRLSDADMWQLYLSFVADLDAQSMQRISGELQQMLSGMAESASRTGSQAEVYGEELQGLSTALSSGDGELLTPAVANIIARTAQMKASTLALEQQVNVSQQEITRLKAELTRTRDDSFKDALTGVLNRKGFDQKLTDMLAQPLPGGQTHGLIMLDIDHFKAVNDTHGHVMGDRVLQALGEVLRSVVAGDADLSVARYGGEEFAILMPERSLAQCQKLAELVCAHTRAMKIRDRRTKAVVLTVTISGGVATMRQGDDAQALIARADAALYQSKQAGRDRITCAPD
ncbi:MAG: GGDEF domain-containing protein [Rhodoferax sp.]|uniref:GGDEF domain-containing protein n=1 Tax=Rhodoferax sp. TaxID=50421 RepID=UPI002603FA8B|nr:GGDEF domain-containing protein [Rhodoferax sp.]MDD2880100.1 GGDEF domain-containing protein [Rhodoferax sp.]